MSKLQINSLIRALSSFKPYDRGLKSIKQGAKTASGQVWTTLARPGIADLSTEASCEDPLLVVVIEAGTGKISGQVVHLVAPIFRETEMAGPDDIVLSHEVLGFRAVVALGSTVSILGASLNDCLGAIPEKFKDELVSLALRGLAGEELTTSLSTGVEYLGKDDLRYKFHEELIDKMAYLQEPVLALTQKCGIFTDVSHANDVPIADVLDETLIQIDRSIWRSHIERQHLALAASTEEIPDLEESFRVVGMPVQITSSLLSNGFCEIRVFDQQGKMSGSLDGAILRMVDGSCSEPVKNGILLIEGEKWCQVARFELSGNPIRFEAK